MVASISATRFNPRLASEARRTAGQPARRRFLAGFNPRLASEARRTEHLTQLEEMKAVSIHASPQRQGEPSIGIDADAAVIVSIHASPQRQGERVPSGLAMPKCAFQSTPRLRGKANLSAEFLLRFQHLFQSTPRLRGKANAGLSAINLMESQFQSTPRLRGKANAGRAFALPVSLMFQSTPRLRGKANFSHWPIPWPASSFNPRLASEARRTSAVGFARPTIWSFNPRLASEARRTNATARRLHRKRVSIHASPQRQGELRLAFNPAERDSCFNPRLASEARRTPAFVRSCWMCTRFNPRLASEARRTGEEVAWWTEMPVSIHASPQRQGEQHQYVEAFKAHGFQSTPRLRGKANVRTRPAGAGYLPFQSTPRLRGKANATSSVPPVAPDSFQSTPRLRGKANAG